MDGVKRRYKPFPAKQIQPKETKLAEKLEGKLP